MSGKIRQDEIVEMLLRETQLSIRTLADRFDVSPMTIYRDLQALEAQTRIIRTNGGAMIRQNLQYGRGWLERLQEQSFVKQLLGQRVAALVKPGQVVIFDAGTTVLEVARHIPDDMRLTVVTNSLPAVAALGEKKNIDVLLAGGQFRPDTASVLGSFTTAFLNQINADVVVLSTAVVNLEHGLSNFSMDSVAVKRTMITRARRVILVCDFSKFQPSALITVAPLTQVHTLVTDDRLPESMRQQIRNAGVELILIPYREECPRGLTPTHTRRHESWPPTAT